MLIKFDKYFLKYTSFKDEITVKGENLNECLQNLFNDYPQLLVHLLEGNAEQADKTSFRLNGSYIYEASSLWITVGAEDVLEFGREIPEGEGAVGKIIAGVVLIVVGAVLQFTGFFSWASPWLYRIGAALIVSGLAEAIIGTPSLPTYDNNNSTSSTYTFSGIKNTTVAGTPVNIVYGRHRVGGHLINVFDEFVVNDNYLKALIGLCEGEIDSIEAGSIEINNRRISEFPRSDFEVFHRTGTKAQLPPSAPLWTIKNNETDIVFPFTEFVIPKGTGAEIETVAPATSIELTLRSNITPTGTFSIYWYTDQDTFVDVNRDVVYPIPYNIRVYYKLVDDTNDYTKYQDFVLKGSDHNIDDITYYDSEGVLCSIKLDGLSAGVYKLKLVLTIPPIDGVYRSEATIYLEPKYKVLQGDSYNYDIKPWIPGFSVISNTVSQGLIVPNDPSGTVTASSPGLEITTTKAVEELTATVSCNGMYKSSGADLTEATVEGFIYFKRSTDSNYNEVDKVPFKISGKTKVEVLVNIPIPVQKYAPSIINIKVIRTTPNNDDIITIQDKVYVKEITEILNDALIYPHTALLGVKIKATDQISGSMPTITSIVKGLKVAVPVGYNGSRRYQDPNVTFAMSSEKQWTNNPVWCLYDFITNTRYGLGNYFKIDDNKRGIMLANFKVMSDYCDVRIKDDGTVVTDPNSADWEEARPRFSLDIVMDNARSAIEWLTTICASMRATPFYSEGIFWIDIDRPKPITQLFCMSNIRDFTRSGMSYRNMVNTYNVQFINKNNDFEQDAFVVESNIMQQGLNTPVVEKTLQLIGVVDYRQVQALAKYTLLTSEKLTNLVTFKTGTEGILCTIGDVIGIQHDVPSWSVGGGKITEVTGGNVVHLSSSVDLESNKSYQVMVSVNGEQPTICNVESVLSGSYDSITITTNLDKLVVGANYVIGEVDLLVKPFKVVSIKRDADEFVELACIDYSEDIYTAVDDISGYNPFTLPIYSKLSDPIISSVANFKVEDRVYIDSAGSVKVGVDCYYTVPNALNWKGVVVNYGLASGEAFTQLPINKSGYVFIPDIAYSGTYRFIACSVYTDGTQQSINQALSDTSNMPFADLSISAALSNNVSIGGIAGLQLKGQANDNVFTGKDATFTWRKPQLLDSLTGLPAGEESNGAGSNTSEGWLSYYRIEVFNPNGSIRFTDRVNKEEYTYSYAQNLKDGLTRSFTIGVTAVDRLGRNGTTTKLSVSNPAPNAISTVSLSSFIRSYGVNFSPSADTDVSYYVVYASTTTGFTPTENLVINRGPETSLVQRVTVGGTYYVRIAAVDAFGEDQLNYSAEYSVYVGDMQILPDELYGSLRTDFWVRGSIFNFINPGTASTTLQWSTGSIIRGDQTYTLNAGTMTSANNKYIIATLADGAATLSSATFGAVPVLNANQVIIAITSSTATVGTNNYTCYVRQANSVELDGALIRNATIKSAQIAEASITQAHITGLVVGDAGISMGPNANISWGSLDPSLQKSVDPLTFSFTGNCTLLSYCGVTKTGGVVAWDSSARSTQCYKGGAYASFTIYNNTWIMAGLNTEDAGSFYTDLDFSWYICHDDDILVLKVYESGNQVAGPWPASTNDKLEVLYDGSTVRYVQNGITRYVNSTPKDGNNQAISGRNLYFDSSFYGPGGALDFVRFGAYHGVAGTYIDKDGVYTGALTAQQIYATNASIGSLAAGTVTGSTIRTVASGARVEMSSETNTFRVYDSDGASSVSIGPNGGWFSSTFGRTDKDINAISAYAQNVTAVYAQSNANGVTGAALGVGGMGVRGTSTNGTGVVGSGGYLGGEFGHGINGNLWLPPVAYPNTLSASSGGGSLAMYTNNVGDTYLIYKRTSADVWRYVNANGQAF